MESWISDLGLQRSVADSRIAIAPQYSLSFAKEHQKPYFGRQLSAFQSPPVRYALLADLVRQVLRGKASVRILEVGSWAGASAITFATVIRELGISDGKIVCIDQWGKYFVAQDKSLHYKCMDAAIAQGEIQKLFRHNITACGVGDMVEIKQARSCEALPELESGAYDLVYLDGSHKKDDVLCDLYHAKRLVCSGGVICGDDLELQRYQIDLDAHQIALGKNADFLADPRTGVGYHPGVTEAVAETFDGVWQARGLWCMKRSGGQWSIPDFRPGNLEIPTHLQHAVEIPYGLYNGYEIFQFGEGVVAYPMCSSHWFQDRVVCGEIEELVLLLDAIERIDQAPFPQIVESRNGFNIARSKGKIWILAQSAGSVDFHDQEQLKRLTGTGQLLQLETMEEARATIDRMSTDEVSNLHIVESRDGFNIVKFKEKTWLVDQSAGSIDFLDQERVQRLITAGQVVEVQTMEEAQAVIERISAPYVVESRSGFNIVSYKGKKWVVDQSAGEVDFRDEQQLHLLATTGQLVKLESLEEARGAIDRVVQVDTSFPRVVESRDGYNIVSCQGKSWAVDQSLGNVDFGDQEQLRRLAATGRLILTETISDARLVIDRVGKEKATC